MLGNQENTSIRLIDFVRDRAGTIIIITQCLPQTTLTAMAEHQIY